jgi:DNA-binding transcriptional regulator PaaX
MGQKFGSQLGDAILNAVADGIEILQYGCYKPSALMRYGLDNLKTIEAERERRRIRVAICRLKKRKLIAENNKRQIRAFRLTLLGECYLKNKNQPPPPILPDELKTIISFDIPEQHRKARDALRRYLKHLGFQRLHWSVWFSDRDWLERLADQIKNSKTDNWVSIIQGRIK